LDSKAGRLWIVGKLDTLNEKVLQLVLQNYKEQGGKETT
jgi:hypothetical protein